MIYPCDTKNDDGKHHCPFENTHAGYKAEMCRVCCGMGADETRPDYEEVER